MASRRVDPTFAIANPNPASRMDNKKYHGLSQGDTGRRNFRTFRAQSNRRLVCRFSGLAPHFAGLHIQPGQDFLIYRAPPPAIYPAFEALSVR